MRAQPRASLSPILHPDHPVFQKVRSPDDLVGEPIALLDGVPPSRLTRAERSLANVMEIRQMEAAALYRIRNAAPVEDEDSRASLMRPGVFDPPRPPMTGPYQSTRRFLEGRKVNGAAIMFGLFMAVGIAVVWAFGYMLANWVY